MPKMILTTYVSELSGSKRFSGSALNYSSLLLEDEAGLLYVGARGALYALQTSNISSTGHIVSTKLTC